MTNQFSSTNAIRNIALVVAMVFGFAGFNASAQMTYSTTTLSQTVTSKSARNVIVASTTGINGPQIGVAQGGVGSPNPAGNITYLYVDRELMRVMTAPGPANQVTVERGSNGTAATAHMNGATVYIGYAAWFPNYEPSGGCTPTATSILPYFVTSTGNEWSCPSSGPTANTWTMVATQNTYTLTDGFAFIDPGACTMTVGTATGTPAIIRAAAANTVLSVTQSAATGTVTVDCSLAGLQSRFSANKGVTITSVDLLYGTQGSAITSIAAPLFDSVAYPTTVGGAASGTVAVAGGTLTVNPGTLQLATTTSGQCYRENIALGTPFVWNNSAKTINIEQVFTTAASATTQICGVAVYYTNNPF